MINLKEVFSRIDPDQFAKEVEPTLTRLLPEMLPKLGRELAPEMWDDMPEDMKQALADEFRQLAMDAVPELMGERCGVPCMWLILTQLID